MQDRKVLLGRRARGEYRGHWCIPCGYVEYSQQSLTVGIWFWGQVKGGRLEAGDDLDAVDYFPLDDLPQPLAFPTDLLVLEQLREDFPQYVDGPEGHASV